MKPRCDVDVSSQCCSCCLRAGWTCICIYLYTHTCVLHVCINISYIHTFVDCYSTCLYTFDTNHTCVYIYIYITVVHCVVAVVAVCTTCTLCAFLHMAQALWRHVLLFVPGVSPADCCTASIIVHHVQC